MFTKREILLFVTGAQTFHTLTHLILGVSGILPIRFFFITLTCQMSIIAIVINVLITAALFWWINRIK